MNKITYKLLKNNKFIYLLHSFIFQIGRTLPHAILVIFLVNKFQTNSSIVLALQLAFYGAIFCFEIPSGFLSDIFNRKKIFLTAIILMIIAFPLIGFSNWLWLVFVGQFLYGVADALSSGTIEISILEQYQNDQDVRKLLAQKRMTFFAAAIIGGGLGPILFDWINDYLYLVATFCFIVSLIICFFIIINEKAKNKEKSKIKTQLKENIKLNFSYFKNKNYLLLFVAILAPIFIFGVFYNYWPVFYQDQKLDSKWFGLIYIILQVIGLISAYLNQKIPSKKIVIILSAIFGCLIFILALIFLKGWSFMIIFPCFLFFTNYYAFETNNLFYKKLNPKTSSSQISILSSINSLISFFIYLILFIFALQFNIYIAAIIGASLFVLTACLSLVFVKINQSLN